MQKFRDLEIGAAFKFFPDHPESKYYGGAYLKVSARKFASALGGPAVKCAVSAGVRRVMTEQEAWKLATNKVASGTTDHCAVWLKDGEYSTAYTRGAERQGYISQSRDGRFWQTTDKDDKSFELDPAKGLMDFRYY